jgi:hypothetical protein
MTQPTRRSVPRAVVIALAGILAVLAVVALVLGVAKLVRGDAGVRGLSKAELAAVTAAKQQTINIQTYRLKSFDNDVSVAVAGMTPDQAAQLQAGKKDLKDRLTRLKQDLGATVSGAGLVSFDGRSAVVLVSSDSQRIDTATGKATTFTQNRYQMTLRLTGGKWLMEKLQTVSL